MGVVVGSLLGLGVALAVGRGVGRRVECGGLAGGRGECDLWEGFYGEPTGEGRHALEQGPGGEIGLGNGFGDAVEDAMPLGDVVGGGGVDEDDAGDGVSGSQQLCDHFVGQRAAEGIADQAGWAGAGGLAERFDDAAGEGVHGGVGRFPRLGAVVADGMHFVPGGEVVGEFGELEDRAFDAGDEVDGGAGAGGGELQAQGWG